MPACKACGSWFVKIKPHEELCDKCECALYRLSGYVAPVVHGQWGMHSDRPDSLICSVCNCGFDMWKHDPHNYCPNCGAKMEGGDNDANKEVD